MPATAAPAAAPPAPPLRRRMYTTVDPRCEWASTEHDDTLVIDVSGFRKEELRVLYSTNRKLKVTGERQVDGAQWARFVKVFRIPRSCDAGAIRAKMNMENARLSVVLPKRSSSSSSEDKQNEKQSMGEHKGQGSAGGSLGSSSGSLYSAQEDAETDKVGERIVKNEVEEREQRDDQGMEKQRPEAMAVQDLPKRSDGDVNAVEGDDAMAVQDLPKRSDGDANAVEGDDAMAVQDLPKRSDGDANAVEGDDGDDKGESKKWWRKIRVVHVLGFVLILALAGVGATLLCVMLL